MSGIMTSEDYEYMPEIETEYESARIIFCPHCDNNFITTPFAITNGHITICPKCNFKWKHICKNS